MERSKILLLGCLFLLTVPVLLYGGNPSKRGAAGALELLLPVGARGTAMGGSAVSSLSGVESIHWNPAGLARGWGSSSVEVMFSHMNYIADIGLDYAVVGILLGDFGTVGLSLRSLDFGDIQETTEDLPEGTGRTFSPNYVTLGLSYAKSLTDRIQVGFTTKVISESILRTAALGFALDAGVIYYVMEDSPLKGLHFGVTLKNIGPNMKYDGEDLERIVIPPNSDPGAVPVALRFPAQSFELPSTFELGVGYDITFSDNNRVSVLGKFQNMNFGNDQYRIGGEYSYDEMVFVRGGYEVTDSETEKYIFGATVGGGFSYQLGEIGISVDYAYMDTKIFQGTNTFSVRLKM